MADEIKITLECSECGSGLKFNFQSENMLMTVNLCPKCKNEDEADILRKFWKELNKRLDKLSDEYDIL